MQMTTQSVQVHVAIGLYKADMQQTNAEKKHDSGKFQDIAAYLVPKGRVLFVSQFILFATHVYRLLCQTLDGQMYIRINQYIYLFIYLLWNLYKIVQHYEWKINYISEPV
jgi:hypothetical protein